jgi:predicted nucleic acid-binding protein
LNFVLDASVALAWAFEDERSRTAVAVLDELERSEAITSTIWSLEVVNGLLTAERRGRISAPDANRFGALLLELPIVVDPVERRRPFDATRALARSHRLTAYDASYLEVGLRLGLPLATLDERLARAAADAGVALLDT